MTFADIRSYLRDTWRDRDLVVVCEAIVDYLERADADQLLLLTYPNLRDIAGRHEIDDVLVRAVNVLTTSRLEMLEPHLLFEDVDGREFDLATEVVKEFVKSGTLVHPQSGEVIADAERQVIPYFCASEEVRSLKGRTGG